MHQFDGMAHLLFSEQSQTTLRQTRQEAVSDEPPVQTIPISKITPNEITLEIYPSLWDFNNEVIMWKPSCRGPWDTHWTNCQKYPSQTGATHWLPSLIYIHQYS